MTEKKSFILYHDTYAPIKALTQEQKGDLLDAIFHYSMDNQEDKLPPIVSLAFQFIKNYLDRDYEKWEKRAEASRDNGAKGGRPVSITSNKSKPRKPAGLSSNLAKPRKPVSVNANVSVNENDINIKKPSALVKKTVNPLYKAIHETFLSKNGGKFTNYAKEGKGVNGLILKAENRDKDNPDLFIQGVIEQFYRMTNNGDKYWNSQPFLPSILNSDGIFDRVLKQLQDAQPKDLEINTLEGITW